MNFKNFSLVLSLLLFSTVSFAQPIQTTKPQTNVPIQETLERISNDLTDISKSLETFNERLNQFLDNLNKYKGIQISEQQQKLLFGYEVLNQTE